MAATSSSYSLLLSNSHVVSAFAPVSDGDDDDNFGDACSICLEPFTTHDPSTVTCCKHEYHLQCILEWSQRSKECPICWQLLALKDPASQELLAAVETERLLRSRNTSSAPASASSNIVHFRNDFDVEEDSYSDDSDFEERFMLHLAAASSRAHNILRRDRQSSSGQGPSPVPICPSPANVPNLQQPHLLDEEGQNANDGSSGGNTGTPIMASPAVAYVQTAVNRDIPLKPRVLLGMPSTDAAQTPSEGLSFSESIKSKWFAASSRYKESINKSKESINKSTRGIKEKLLAHNYSVKELSKGVQREMSAGIASVARMIDRLDLTPKQTGASGQVSACTAGTSDLSLKGKGMQDSFIMQSFDGKSGEITHATSLDVPLHVTCDDPGRVEVHHVQRHQ